MSSWGAREANAKVTLGAVGGGGGGALLGAKRPAAAARLGPAPDAGLEEEAVDDQLAAAFEQVGQADLAVRAVEAVVLGHRLARQPPALGGERVAGAGQLLLLHQQLGVSGIPLRRRDDRWQVHFFSSFR